MADQSSIKQLEADLWSAADVLRSSANLNANQYCMPVLGLLFLKYAYGRYKRVEVELMKNRPSRGGVKMPVTAQDFRAKSALYLPREAQYDYLLNLPGNIASANIVDEQKRQLTSLGDVVNYAMRLIEQQTDQLKGILPDTYNIINDEVLAKLLRIFNNDKLEQVGGDVIGRIYEYFTGKFSKAIADDDGVFFTPKSLVQMIVNIIEPSHGTVLDPACGSGGMFVQSGDFVNNHGMNANSALTFYGQEKVTFNARLCLMNMAVHGLNAIIKSGDEANTYTQDAHNLVGECDFVMANPPFNVNGVEEATVSGSNRLPFGLPAVNKDKEISNANYLWIQYFYAYLNETGRAGFVMASSATDSQSKDRTIREKLVKTGHVDCLISVANNFFYTLTLPCTLWFFDKNKREQNRDKILFIDSRNYYTVVEKTLNEWNEWQMRNINAIVWLYRGETDKYRNLISTYRMWLNDFFNRYDNAALQPVEKSWQTYREGIEATLACFKGNLKKLEADMKATRKRKEKAELKELVEETTMQVAEITEALDVINQLIWLVDKFGEDGTYRDIPGLCRIADISEVEGKNFSLTPGAYTGAEETASDDVDFTARMKEIHAELEKLQNESAQIFATIKANESLLWK
ncbi:MULTISPECIES: class I SAM-dependent DNA methyltransferase [Bacteroidales]|jgi:type I restriction enzyme M protein|uniref:type I restriction-modification system subunit M n=1 Tax=Bacteroidales TaxID=171549 RepID=UPI000F483AA4|nr:MULTISPECIES: class I SAM-dependent DNA methyltransferase [Bacteroidales]ROT03661.1 SAM-dependent DNA methyltransferase [Muribaculaceae bacterium Isolate-100 (HZI)]RXE64086.1 SAM-dependent DNA methyltransferase [Muribaculaceae bacterium Isolate-007 (NCI)]RXE67977.1 SAM-dependent DNA methyltransferase [Muribaculaceae bacterium Isolate-001 (NCI)]